MTISLVEPLNPVTHQVGFIGGYTSHPTYDQVRTGSTNHVEVVRVVYQPAQISFKQLLKIFWDSHDPTQGMKQGPHMGTQYRWKTEHRRVSGPHIRTQYRWKTEHWHGNATQVNGRKMACIWAHTSKHETDVWQTKGKLCNRVGLMQSLQKWPFIYAPLCSYLNDGCQLISESSNRSFELIFTKVKNCH